MSSELRGFAGRGKLVCGLLSATFTAWVAITGARAGNMSLELPVGAAQLPSGVGAGLANAQCLMCHSAEMVTLQPPLSLEEWTAEINKMRKTYGAPLPVEQTGPLAAYLHGINGR